jgi:hypothetical protein
MNPPEQEQTAPGLQGGGEMAGPLGLQGGVPLDGGADEKKPATSGSELNLVGSYPKPKEWTAAKELEEIKADRWFPHTLDFLAVAGRGSKEITSPEDFLLKIIEASGPIQRLNYFSHGMRGLIATSGVIDTQKATCSLDSGWTSVSGERRIADPYAKVWGDDAQDSGTTAITVGSQTFTLDQVRAKFTADAEIWLYTCQGGGDMVLLRNLANTFKVTVRGFSNAIVYCAPANFPGSRQHRVNMKATGRTEKEACPDAVLDFRKLKPDLSRPPK